MWVQPPASALSVRMDTILTARAYAANYLKTVSRPILTVAVQHVSKDTTWPTDSNAKNSQTTAWTPTKTETAPNAPTVMTWTHGVNVYLKARTSVNNTVTSTRTVTGSRIVVARAQRCVKSAPLATTSTDDTSARRFLRTAPKSIPETGDVLSVCLGTRWEERLVGSCEICYLIDALKIYHFIA